MKRLFQKQAPLHPHLHQFTAHLAKHFEAPLVIQVGGGDYTESASLKVDNLPPKKPLSNEQLQGGIVLATNLATQSDPQPYLATLSKWLEQANCALIMTPDRTRTPDGKWNRDEFETLLQGAGLRVEMVGYVPDSSGVKTQLLAIALNHNTPQWQKAPDSFKVAALVNIYNEVDIVLPWLERMWRDNIDVHVIDNWSTDGTSEILQQVADSGRIHLTKYPPDQPSASFELATLMAEWEKRVPHIQADWFVNIDVDELRDPPNPNYSLRDGLYFVDRSGFNAINHTVLNFYPIDDTYQAGDDFGDHFEYCELGKFPGFFRQVRGWKRPSGEFVLARTKGHEMESPTRRVYPFKFLLRHYTFRNQEQSRRKVEERQKRIPPTDKRKTIRRYQVLGDTFIWKPEDLIHFDEDFYREYLLERLAGVGIELLKLEDK